MYMKDGKKILDEGFVCGDISYPPNWIMLATEDERLALGITVAPDHMQPDNRLGTVIENEDGTYGLIPFDLTEIITNCCDKIDTTVSSVYTQWTRFEVEYNKRLVAAREYVDAGHVGEPNVYLSSYAHSANVSYSEAADNVILQSVMFDEALTNLSMARMRKFEVKRATTVKEALDLTDTIVNTVMNIASQIS